MALKSTGLSDWSSKAGDSALRQVQFLASKVAESTAAADGNKIITKDASKTVRGIGGVVYNNPEYNKNMDQNYEVTSILNPNMEISTSAKREDQVWMALANLELDSKF